MTDEPSDMRALLATEIERRLKLLCAGDSAAADVRAALHSLRGSTAMAGQHELSLLVAQFGVRVRRGDLAAIGEAASFLGSVLERLRAGLLPFSTSWPEPPPGLRPCDVDVRYRMEYLATMRDRLVELESCVSTEGNARTVLEHAYRTVHAIKGAASSVGDDTTAWYCHGLEARLKSARSELQVRDVLAELERHRAMIRLLIEEPAEALEHLRLKPASQRPPSALGDAAAELTPNSGRGSRPPPGDDESDGEDVFLRIRADTVDRFLERLARIELVHDELSGAADVARQMAARMRELRASLHEALRLIGPPRPWGAPAAALQRIEATARTLGAATENAQRGAQLFRRNAEVVRARAAEMRADISTLRRTSVAWLFDRVTHAVERLAAGFGLHVRVVVGGADLAIDRRVAERLLDPIMQLARNAVAHGIQPPEVRVRSGKPASLTLFLEAQKLGDWLRIVVEDDGGGVDVGRIRELAVRRGAISGETANAAHDDELLALLFLPGLTTQEGADLLAGRGVGLDLAGDVVRRLGGAIRLGSRPGNGLVATIEVPGERGVMDVVWLAAGEHEFALPVSFTGRLEAASDPKPVLHLATCLGLPVATRALLSLELVIHGVQPISIGVDAVGEVEETSIRSVPSLIASAGPYCGAILRGDGSLRLALDAALLAARAWARAAHDL